MEVCTNQIIFGYNEQLRKCSDFWRQKFEKGIKFCNSGKVYTIYTYINYALSCLTYVLLLEITTENVDDNNLRFYLCHCSNCMFHIASVSICKKRMQFTISIRNIEYLIPIQLLFYCYTDVAFVVKS